MEAVRQWCHSQEEKEGLKKTNSHWAQVCWSRARASIFIQNNDAFVQNWAEVSCYGETNTKCQYIMACEYYGNLSYDEHLASSNTITLQARYETLHGTEYPKASSKSTKCWLFHSMPYLILAMHYVPGKQVKQARKPKPSNQT
jgi:hypothetical protein